MSLFKTSPKQQAAKELKAAQAKELKELKARQAAIAAKAKGPKAPSKKLQAVKNGTAAVVTFVARDLHFVFKSTADGVARGEAVTVNKLTGKAKFAIIEDRHNTTERMQGKVKDTAFMMRKLLSSKSKAPSKTAEVAYESQVNSIV